MRKNKFGIKIIELDSSGDFLSCTDLLEDYSLKEDISQVGKIEANSSAGQINLQCQTVTSLMIQNHHDTQYITVSFKDSAGVAVSTRIPAGMFAILPDVIAASTHVITIRTQTTAGEVVYSLCGNNPVVS